MDFFNHEGALILCCGQKRFHTKQVTRHFGMFNENYHEKIRSRSTMCQAQDQRDL